MTQFVSVLLPVSAVKCVDVQRFHGFGIQAPCIDAITLGIGARHVERLDSTHTAEIMLGDTGIELIVRHVVMTTEQLEIFLAHDEMQVT